jgi:hypothetical protein
MLMTEGSLVTLVIADPWDLVGPGGENRLAGSVERTVPASEATDRDTVVLRLDDAITYKEVEYDRVVFQARGDEPILELLGDGRTVEVSVYGVPADDKPSSIDPRDWWRGGLGASASAIPT